jgi:hypothetical protein
LFHAETRREAETLDRFVIPSVRRPDAMLEGDRTRETFTTEAQRRTEGTEEVKSF